jgi:uncharacterized protein (DUF362 family)
VIMKKAKVSIVRVDPKADVKEISNALRHAIHFIGGLSAYVEKGQKILIKPNMTGRNLKQIVNPRVIYAVADLFSGYGCSVKVGEDTTDHALKIHDLYGICRQTGTELINFRKDLYGKIRVLDPIHFRELEVTHHALASDMTVSLAKMKTVNVCHVSLCQKNLKGLMPVRLRHKFHSEGLNMGIVDLNKVIRQGLAIIDGTYAMDNVSGKHKPVGLIIAGDNRVAVDAVCVSIMGLDINKIDHIILADKAGLGPSRIDEIEILGEKISDLIGKYKFSEPFNPLDIAGKTGGGIEIFQGNPCSACLNELGNDLREFCKKYGFDNIKDVAILVGPDATKPKNRKHVFLYGNCLLKRKNEGIFINGCPPGYRRAVGTVRGELAKIIN